MKSVSKTRKPPVVQVTWIDSTSGPGWRTPEDARAWIALGCDSIAVGHLVSRDRKQLTLATNWRDLNSHTSDLFQIPAGCIKQVQMLKPGKMPW